MCIRCRSNINVIWINTLFSSCPMFGFLHFCVCHNKYSVLGSLVHNLRSNNCQPAFFFALCVVTGKWFTIQWKDGKKKEARSLCFPHTPKAFSLSYHETGAISKQKKTFRRFFKFFSTCQLNAILPRSLIYGFLREVYCHHPFGVGSSIACFFPWILVTNNDLQ